MLSHFSCEKMNTTLHICMKFVSQIYCVVLFFLNFCCICLNKYIVTHRCGQNDVGVLNLKEVIDLRVARQLLTVQPQRTKLLLPALKALAAEGFDRGHWQDQTVKGSDTPQITSSEITRSKPQCMIRVRCIVLKHCGCIIPSVFCVFSS